MRCSFCFFIFFFYSAFGFSQVIQADSGKILEYLLIRDFDLYRGIPTEWQNNREVHGKTEMERSLKFTSDSTFEECIFVEGRPFFVMKAETDTSIKGLSSDREIAIRSGSWKKVGDTLFLNYQWEFIHNLSSYQRFINDKLYYPEKVKEMIPLRSRFWREEKSLIIDIERGLCLDRPGDFCYR